jgi:hypothetical protein
MSDVAIANTPTLPKTLVREALDRMPENASFEEIIEEIGILAGLERAERDIEEGRLSAHAEVKARARQWRSE